LSPEGVAVKLAERGEDLEQIVEVRVGCADALAQEELKLWELSDMGDFYAAPGALALRQGGLQAGQDVSRSLVQESDRGGQYLLAHRGD